MTDRTVRIPIAEAAAAIAAARTRRSNLDEARRHGLDARRRRKLAHAWCDRCFAVSSRGPDHIQHKAACPTLAA
jgi:hypothetical protein